MYFRQSGRPAIPLINKSSHRAKRWLRTGPTSCLTGQPLKPASLELDPQTLRLQLTLTKRTPTAAGHDWSRYLASTRRSSPKMHFYPKPSPSLYHTVASYRPTIHCGKPIGSGSGRTFAVTSWESEDDYLIPRLPSHRIWNFIVCAVFHGSKSHISSIYRTQGCHKPQSWQK